jgi:hypothetical protein
MREVVSAPKEFLEALAKDPDVADWLISVTEIQRTRDDYLEYAGRFFGLASYFSSRPTLEPSSHSAR